MAIHEEKIKTLAAFLDSATLEKREVERLTLANPELSLSDAYRIQGAGIKLRVGRGEKVIGFKMGLTSQAKREQMNLNSPIFGVLTDQMEVPDGGSFSLEKSIHPKIEPEIAFILGRDLKGNISAEEAWAACSGVCAALEILDSRFLNFKYFSLPDVVADNCSSSYFIVSETMKSPSEIGMSHLGHLNMEMSVDGSVVQQSPSSAISGHPVNSLVQLSQMLHEMNLYAPAGSVVLAGAATQAVPLVAGHEVKLTVEKIGSVSVKVATAHRL